MAPCAPAPPPPVRCCVCAAQRRQRAAACRAGARAAAESSAQPQVPPAEPRTSRPRAHTPAARPAAAAAPRAKSGGAGNAAPGSKAVGGGAAAAAFAASAAKLPPLVRRVLLEGADPASVDARALLAALPLARADKAAALAALEPAAPPLVLRRPGALSAAQCAALRALVAARVRGDATDSADGCPEWQVNLDRQALEGVIGAPAVAGLWALPRLLDPARCPPRFTQVRVFCRAYGVDKRPHLRLHTDASDYTVNVALADDAAHAGGRLALLHDGALHAPPRAEGEATAHRWSVCHGVTAMTAGTRYSLIIFFHHRRLPVM